MSFGCTEIISKKHLVRFLNVAADGKTPKCLVMKSGEGVRKVTKFKYFRLYVTGTSGDSTIQFTHLKFYSNSGTIFSYWSGTESKSTIKNYVTATCNKGYAGANGGEAAEYGLLTDPTEGKCCWLNASPSSSSPFIITYELLSKTLDVSTYRNWCWYTANNTSTSTGRNIMLFKLQVSNDNSTWITVDENTSASNIKTTSNWSLAYEHALDLTNL